MAEKYSFEKWKTLVDQHMIDLVGMSSDDIEDYCYWDAWNDGVSHSECAEDALRASGWAGGLIED